MNEPGSLLDDGELPPGTTPFDDYLPGVGNLDGDLLAAVQAAARDAAGDDVQIVVNSGWRSRELQERLLEDAVAEHGSRAEAARWVATPDRSAHVTGEAIDIGPWAAMDWLAMHGAAYGLCQIYANEAWHFELRPEAPVEGCPRQLRDPTAAPH